MGAAAGPSPAPPLLRVDGLRIAASGALPALQFDLRVQAGEMCLVYSQDRDRSTAVADALIGLDAQAQGGVFFQGHAWVDMAPSAAQRLRGEIGRVLSRGNWLETRSVMENLLLPLRHHTVLPDEALRDMACDYAQRFGLPGLPLLLPQQCPDADLERAACIRAFLGRPQLVILEHPMDFADSGLLSPLVGAIQQMRRRGGAVIWFTRSRRVFDDRSIVASRRLQIAGGHLLEREL